MHNKKNPKKTQKSNLNAEYVVTKILHPRFVEL